jgi:hypothetical protein
MTKLLGILIVATTLVVTLTATKTDTAAVGANPASTITVEPPQLPPPGPVIDWTPLASAGASQSANAQQKILFDPVSGQILQYGTDNFGIYSTAIFFGAISGNTNNLTKLSSTGGATTCDTTYPASVPGGWNNGDGSPQQPWPADRHPEFQMAIDTLRNALYLWSGLACGNPGPGDGIAYRDLWRLSLNSDPLLDGWQLIPGASKTSEISSGGSMVYVAPYDVLVLHSAGPGVGGQNPETWVLCPTQGAPLNANHRSVGCVQPDVWARAYDTANYDPSPYGYNMTVYDPGTNKVLLFELGPATKVWAYHLTNKTWTQLPLLTTIAGPMNIGSNIESLITIATSGRWANKVFYRRTCHDGLGLCGFAADFMFDPQTSNWTHVLPTGTGPSKLAYIAFAPNIGIDGALIAWEPNGVGWWKGVLR